MVIDGELRSAVIEVSDGRIVAISPWGTADQDFGELIVMPGLVDTHVHVNEPGRTNWEGFASATRAAAAGGTTTIVDMPLNSVPPTISLEGLEEKRGSATDQVSVDVAFWGGVVPGSVSNVPSLVDAGVCGFKAFMVDSGVPEFPPVTEHQLTEAMTAAAEANVPLLIHAEDPRHLARPQGDPTLYSTYLATRPVEAEAAAVQTVSRLASETGAETHILHISSGSISTSLGEMGLSGETCPHYLTFAAEEIPDGATLFKCAPPIRGEAHREALWESLGRGDLQMVVSDHSPAPDALKAVDTGDFIEAWGGISSLQLRLPATWSGASERGFAVPDVVEWLATAPARLAGLSERKGSIEVGKDADLVVWDPEGVTRVEGARLEHRHPGTPYEGMELRGRVVVTILRGTEVYENGHPRLWHGRMLGRS